MAGAEGHKASVVPFIGISHRHFFSNRNANDAVVPPDLDGWHALRISRSWRFV
jgi:hypothetical protein